MVQSEMAWSDSKLAPEPALAFEIFLSDTHASMGASVSYRAIESALAFRQFLCL